MAFTTQEGTGGAPWTFLGTPEADQIAVITGNTQNSEAFDFIAEGFEGDDTVNFNGTRSVTIKGGQGADVITNNIAASAGLTSIITTSFINGNDGDDRIGNTELGLLATLSTVSGGQGADKLYLGSLQSSKVNGNLGGDFLEVGDVTFDETPLVATLNNFNAASIFGGQGNDAIRVRSQSRAFTNSEVNGQLGDDAIQIQIGTFDLNTAIRLNALTVPGFSPDNGILTSPTTTGSTFDGGDGNDILDASGLLLDIKQGGRVEIDANINNASGSDLDLFGGEGNDSMFGGVGEDLVDGGNGDDWLAGYGGRDEVVGGNGNDLIIGAYFDGELSVGFIGDGAGDTLSGGVGSNRFFIPGSGSPRGVGASFFNGLGSTQNILVTKTTTGSVATASATIENGDFITVGFGADVITDWNAGAGNNTLDTGIGNNLLVGATAAQMSLGVLYDGATSNVSANNFAVRGFYTERFNEQGQFVVNANGTDIAVWTNYGSEFGTVTSPTNVLTSSVSNFTILKGVSTSVVVTANEFVAL